MFRSIFLVATLAISLMAALSTSAEARTYNRGYRRYSYRGSLMSRPQYPRSMRTRGMKQLGAYPALGGVRSLPFWGGER